MSKNCLVSFSFSVTVCALDRSESALQHFFNAPFGLQETDFRIGIGRGPILRGPPGYSPDFRLPGFVKAAPRHFFLADRCSPNRDLADHISSEVDLPSSSSISFSSSSSSYEPTSPLLRRPSPNKLDQTNSTLAATFVVAKIVGHVPNPVHQLFSFSRSRFVVA
ncbi:hypothetical protein KSP39_PZI000378 [Platanthera zijinensis]|uniref:Uncharacterized protein n=1 Tax=Platanthera zijinensis TaxID=2320716 RepID=A0AAP0C189_9ASPA